MIMHKAAFLLNACLKYSFAHAIIKLIILFRDMLTYNLCGGKMEKVYRQGNGPVSGTLKLIGVIFTLVGIGLLIGGSFWLVRDINFVKQADVVQAEITKITERRDSDGDISHTVYVEYEYNGERFFEKLSEYSSSMYEGKRIELYIDPQAPSEVRYARMAYFASILFFIMGGVFSVVGFVIMRAYSRSRKNEYMDTHGREMNSTAEYGSSGAEACIYAEIIDCALDNTYSEDERKPWRLYCRYADEQLREHYYTSDPIWTDGSKYIGRIVPVYVQDDEHYRVYVEALLKES